MTRQLHHSQILRLSLSLVCSLLLVLCTFLTIGTISPLHDYSNLIPVEDGSQENSTVQETPLTTIPTSTIIPNVTETPIQFTPDTPTPSPTDSPLPNLTTAVEIIPTETHEITPIPSTKSFPLVITTPIMPIIPTVTSVQPFTNRPNAAQTESYAGGGCSFKTQGRFHCQCNFRLFPPYGSLY